MKKKMTVISVNVDVLLFMSLGADVFISMLKQMCPVCTDE